MGSESFSVRTLDGGAAVLEISGEHDISTAPALRAQLDALIDEGRPVVVDLTPAQFLDSSILGVLLGSRRLAEERGQGFAVALGAEGEVAVRRILEVTGLVPVLPVLDGRDAAVEAVTARGSDAPA